MIDRNRPRDADNPIFLQYFFDQESSTDGAAVTDLACLMFVIEAVDEHRSAALVARLHEQRPTTGVFSQQLGPTLREGRFEPVEHRIGSHSALCHDATLPQRNTQRDIPAGADSLRLTAMDFELSADQVALQSAARELLAVQCSIERVRAAAQSGGFDSGLWAAMVAQGWTAVAVPEALGGLGLGTVEIAVLLEQIGAHLAPVPLTQQLLAIAVLADSPWGAKLISGEAIAAAARTPLTRNSDGSVSGRPEPVIYGARADVLIAPCAYELVAVDLRSVERTPEPAMDQTRELAWITLDHAPAQTIGDAAAVDAHLDRGAVYHSAEMLGGAEAVMNLAVDYAKNRRQFDRPIGSFQAIKHRCADMLVDVEGMRSVVYHAAWAIGADDPEASVAASTAKTWCSDAALRVAESALQVHGGIGFTWVSDVHLYLKRAQLDQTAFGDARHHRARLASMLTQRLQSGGSVLI